MSSTGQQLGLQQGLRQQQTLSPQMRRSLEILQANTTELARLISQAVELNPTLEVTEESPNIEELPTEETERNEENIQEEDDDWRENQIITHAGHDQNREDEERREFLYNSIVAPLTLQQHLANQLNRSALSDQEYETVDYLIGTINERGFLDEPLEKIASYSSFSLDQLQNAQSIIQQFDPAGIGVNNLKDSLLLQLKLAGYEDSLESRIVTDYLADLAKRKIADIARSLNVAQHAVLEAGDHIAKLNPNPGAAFDATSNPHVRADLEIRKNENDDYYIHLTGDHLPKIRVSEYYKDLLAKLNTDPKALKYLKDNLDEARQIIYAVSQRQETLLKTGSEILKRQGSFLNHGWSHLRPMKMQDVAKSIGVHSATISRAVSGKYILTPYGLVELRRFFSSGYTTEKGEEISNTGVKDSIQKLIDSEKSNKPFSDEALKKELDKQGISVARRTVAKYREQMNILPSNLRKRLD